MRFPLLLLLALGCCSSPSEPRRAPIAPHGSPATLSGGAPAGEGADAGTPTGAADAGLSGEVAEEARGLSDRELGALVRTLSEATGDFPSENLVSNETSYLDVAPFLRDPGIEGRAYVGVGPEQNLSYVALARPRIAYVIDIRRENLLLHMVWRATAELSTTRAALLANLTARETPASLPTDASIESICEALAEQPASEERRDTGVARTIELMERLGIPLERGDREAIEHIHDLFFRHGVGLAFSMEGARRRYPPLSAILAERDPEGVPASFVADEETYARLRTALLANRLVPVVGDFAGTHALAAMAADMRARGLRLGVFYASNVEEYLFRAGIWGRFAENLALLPADERSRIVRVWLDRGRPHPAQRPGHRSATIATPLVDFLARNRERPFRSYWGVVRP